MIFLFEDSLSRVIDADEKKFDEQVNFFTSKNACLGILMDEEGILMENFAVSSFTGVLGGPLLLL